MLITLQQIAQLYNVITLQDYLKYLDVHPPHNSFYENTIICSETQNLQKFPIKKPSNFLYQKLADDQRIEQVSTDSRNDFQFQKQKSFIGCQKLLLSDNMENLYKEIGEQNFDFLMKNYKLLLKEDSETYLQISGEPIMKIQAKQKQQTAEKIQRQQILYCNHMSRQVGMFKKNFISYAKKQIIKSNLISEPQITRDIIAIKATSNILDHFYNNRTISILEKTYLRPLLETCVRNLQKFNFHGQFKFYVPLPQKYKQLKQETKRHIKEKLNFSQLLDILYQNHIPHQQITSLLRHFLREVIPIELFGQQNLYTFLTDVSDFITLLRFEDQSYLDYIKTMNVFEIPWLNKYFNKKKQRLLIIKKRNQLVPLMKFLFQEIIIPFLRHNFYITERMKDDWKLFYYRKEVWHLILKLSLISLTKNNFEEISVNSIKTPYIGKLRIVPKPGTFRPIITYNRKAKTSKISLNRKLIDIKYILRNLRIQPLGFSVFGNPEVFSRLEEFKNLWLKLQQPKTYYITMDIQKCYDTIILEKLLQFIEESNQFASIYAINKYHIVSRNNRILKPSFNIKDLFNILDRGCAIPFNKPQLLQRGYIEHIQKNKQTIIINQGFQNSVTFSEFLMSIKNICQNNIVQFENRYFRQTLGIPQGLNISGILCSFYLANLEQKLTNKILGDTLIMRLTDDYCCLAFSKDNSMKILNNFSKIEKQFNIKLNHDKTQHNIEKQDRYFKWIGKVIDIETLTLKPAFYLESDTKFQYQINVNLPTKVKTYYIKSKLKSLILNQFKFFFNSKLNDKATMIKVVKIFVHSGLIKLISFLKRLKYDYETNKSRNQRKQIHLLSTELYLLSQEFFRKQRLKYPYIVLGILDENNLKTAQKNNQKQQLFEEKNQLQINMNQQFYNFLNIPINPNTKSELARIKLAKQFLVAQVLHVFNIWRQTNIDEEIVFGLIGCGQVGKLIINSIVPYSIKYHNLKVDNVHISTRRPEQIYYYQTKGYQVYFDNDKLLQNCNFIVLAMPPVVDNWNVLELVQVTNPKSYIISLLSTLKLKRLKQLLKREQQVYHTQISSSLLDQAILSYLEILESMKPGVFQTQVQEDINKLITEESYKNFVDGQERVMEFLESLGLSDEQYQIVFGRNKKDFHSQTEKHFKTSFTKSILQFQNFIQT